MACKGSKQNKIVTEEEEEKDEATTLKTQKKKNVYMYTAISQITYT